ncbi:MAG: maltose ABC transporter substrate-binding protein [Anaerolineae bacterium]|nr:maltose ABC transporter substrate-binding protein [Anaerolineae bacterium]MCA9888512.1 maltose ABC transporter substrate-binding protein [Anaerolineae bacterium]MCA9893825.1 maltose ABC transporter substrate-binding protein [Anaerolineae bacterium]MCB9460390.1 maltose ABC transporter substrate-binding protein [Anaerolineaceae bacterium]
MKKALLIMAILLLSMSVLPVVAQDTEEEAPLERADADFVVWVDSNYVDAMQALGDQFAADFGVTVAVQESTLGDVDNVIPVAAPAGQGPDVFFTAHDKLGNLVSGGLVAPIEVANPDGFAESAVNAFLYNGDVYGIPFSIENIAFFRNVDLVPEAPATWDDVVAISEELSADNGDNFEDNAYGFVRQSGDPYHFFPIQTAFGGYVFGQTEEGYDPTDVGIASEGSLAAAEFWANYVEQGLQPPGVDWDLLHAMFEDGQAAMIITGPWALDRIRESGVNYEISDLPAETDSGKPFLGVWGFVVNSFSEQQMLAGIFLNEYVATDEGMMALYEANKRGPAWLATIEAIDDPDLAAITHAGVEGLAMPAIPAMSQVWDAWTNAINLVQDQGEDPDASFENAAEQIETLIAESQSN